MKKYQLLAILLIAMPLCACNILPTISRNNSSKSASKEDSGEPEQSFELIIDEANRTATYGLYPQQRVSDQKLKSRLEQLPKNQANKFGWFFLDGKYYVREAATPFDFEGKYRQSPAYFSDRTTIESGIFYWYECSPITWRILDKNDNKYYLLSENCLDISAFNASGSAPSGYFPNSWEVSTLRYFLNNDFLEKAFFYDDQYIIQTEVYNTASTTNNSSNPYAIDMPSFDYVFCPSYEDYYNVDYGFNNDISRLSHTTDYGRARGVWFENQSAEREFCADYFARSPDYSSSSKSSRVSERGELWTYDVTDEFGSVRPAITVAI